MEYRNLTPEQKEGARVQDAGGDAVARLEAEFRRHTARDADGDVSCVLYGAGRPSVRRFRKRPRLCTFPSQVPNAGPFKDDRARRSV